MNKKSAKKSAKTPKEENTKTPIASDVEIKGCRDSLLHGLRATGNGVGVLAIDDVDFFDMVNSDPEYRAMILEMLKMMFVQAGYDKLTTALAEKARTKMAAALAASQQPGVMEAFEHPVDFSKIPPYEEISTAYINAIRPEWKGDAVSK